MLAGREMPVERADADAGAPRNILERGVDAMLGKGGGGDREKFFAVAAGIRPHALSR